MKQFHDDKGFNTKLPAEFHYSKNYGSLTHETRIKDAVNMEDLTCLSATVRTLKGKETLQMNSLLCNGIKQILWKV